MPNRSRTASATSSASPAPARSRARTVGSCRSFFTSVRERMLDPLGDSGVDVAEVAQRALDLPLADRLRLLAKLGEERLDLELPIAAAEVLDLLLDDRLHLRHLAQARRHRVVETGTQVVDVEEPDALDVARLALDVRRNREIDDDQRATGATRHRGADERRTRRSPAVSDEVAVIATSAAASASSSSIETVCGCAEALGDLVRARPSSGSRPQCARSRDRSAAFSVCRPMRPAPTTSTRFSSKSPSSPLRERERHRARGRRVRADRGLRPRAPPGRDGRAEEQREPGA